MRVANGVRDPAAASRTACNMSAGGRSCGGRTRGDHVTVTTPYGRRRPQGACMGTVHRRRTTSGQVLGVAHAPPAGFHDSEWTGRVSGHDRFLNRQLGPDRTHARQRGAPHALSQEWRWRYRPVSPKASRWLEELTDVVEIAPEACGTFLGEGDEHAAAVGGVVLAADELRRNQILDPPQRGRLRNPGRDAQARH